MITTSRHEFARAVRIHQAGDLGVAARLYESFLATDPGHADALHLLGVVRHQQGQHAHAADLIGRALGLRPDVPVYHASMAEVHRATGQFEEAIARGCEAIRLGLDEPAVRNNLGLSLHAVGRYTEAAGAFLAVLDAQPGDALAHANLGASLRALGENERALEHMTRAAELAPQLAAGRNNLGQLLLEMGRPADAIGHCQAAISVQPEMAEAYNNLGNAFRALGHLAEARWCFATAFAKDPARARTAVSLALTLQLEGRRQDALPWFRRASEAEPNSAEYLALLAEAAIERQSFAEAIICYEKIVERNPEDATAYNALGWLSQEVGQFDAARDHLARALELQPGMPAAQLNLGGLHETLGDFATAEARFRAAVDDAACGAIAMARLATLLRANLPDADRQAIERQLADPDASPWSRINLLFGLTQVWDARRQYAEAATCARQANELALARLRHRKSADDPARHEQFISGLIESFTPGLFARLAGAGVETDRPVFIFGLPRSGTTLIEQILSSHSQFESAGELALAREDFEAIPVLLGRREQPIECISDLTVAAVRALAEVHDERWRALDGGKSARACDKMPENYVHLGLLALLFPNAVFIHCRRDLRDVATSCWLTQFQTVPWTNDQRQIAHRFQQYDRLMKHWRQVLPATIHEVDYEETVDDVEGVARRLLMACGLDWEPACLEFHRTRRPIRTASFSQVRQPVYRSSIGRWKNYEAALADLFAALPV